MDLDDQPIQNITLPPLLSGQRALAAIMFTDVESFTAKMAHNEAHAFTLIHRDYGVMQQVCQQWDGKILKSLGDGLLVYFENAEQAVQCAIEIQQRFIDHAVGCPPEDILKHRIGIHLGEVIFSGTDVMGNGVNMAARLQKEALAGGISFSQSVYDAVRNQVRSPVTYLGLRSLKGIQSAVPIYHIAPPTPSVSLRQRVYVSYRDQSPDLRLAHTLYAAMSAAGHSAFMAGESTHFSDHWAQRLETELNQCDYFVLLLSAQSAGSEMIIEEVRRAKELRGYNSNRKPQIVPIRVNFPSHALLDYNLSGFINLQGYLDRIQHWEWHSDADTPSLVQDMLALLSEGRSLEEATTDDQPWSGVIHLPAIAVPEMPEGQVNLASVFYTERPPVEVRCQEAISQPGALLRIKAPRQMGKTSLMTRVLHYAQQQGYHTVPLSLQLADDRALRDLDQFLKWFCASVGRRLQLPNRLADYWDDIFGSKDNCTAYFEEYLLSQLDAPLVIGLDEVDYIFQHPEIAADFFVLLRAWHEDAKSRDIWQKLRLVVVHATEVYVPMDINQSPFNVGTPVALPEFSSDQIYSLAKLHGLAWDMGDVDQLMALISGHPYLVRLALYHLARRDITLAQLLEQGTTESGLYGDHLRRHLWNLEQNPDLLAAMTRVVAADGPVRLDATQAFKLHSIGLVHLQGNEVVPRCYLYRHYLRDRLPSR
ncbi:MAG: TIR domain-containing protein [Leptolyngbya sp. DLM2.Bin15]|nr:MAG: TIR domain-containing protein [Leptolyngbya sp. DLM2.Bin15]